MVLALTMADKFVLGKSFSSFSDVESALNELKKDGKHPLRVFNSQKCEHYNQKRLSRKYPGEAVDASKFQYTYYSVRCVHYGEGRCRGKGLRPVQRSFSLGCQAKITLSYNKGLKSLVVSECNLDHNHRIGEEIFRHYPSARKLSRDEEKHVSEILGLKANSKHVHDLIVKKYGKFVSLKDIQNLKTKVREQTRMGLRDAQLVLDKLTNVLQADHGARGGVITDEDDTLAILYFESSHMAELFSKFPEILFVDGTYNTNKLGMPLTCLMVEDGFGHGRNVFYAATAQEDTTHLQRIVQSFKEQNSAWRSIRVIIIDKDFTEWKVLNEEFPDAVILYCQWHVIKAMFKGMTDCGVEKSNRDECRRIIQLLVHANSEVQYKDLKQELFDEANDEFKVYFQRNWEVCKSMWVTFKRDQHLHFANTTNNRLESHNQKLKDVTSRSSSLSDMFQNVLLYARTCAAEYCQQSFTEEFTAQSGGDTETPTAQEIRTVCTQYAANLEQLKLADTVHYQFTSMETHVVVKYKERSHFVSLYDHSCSCSFRTTLLLPCRHLLAARVYTGTAAFETSLVAARWLKQYQLHVGAKSTATCSTAGELPIDSDCQFQQHEVVVSTLPPPSKMSGTLAKNQKYRKMLSLSQKLAVAASECGMPEFRRMHSTVESLLSYWERNIPVVLTPASDDVSVNQVHVHL